MRPHYAFKESKKVSETNSSCHLIALLKKSNLNLQPPSRTSSLALECLLVKMKVQKSLSKNEGRKISEPYFR